MVAPAALFQHRRTWRALALTSVAGTLVAAAGCPAPLLARGQVHTLPRPDEASRDDVYDAEPIEGAKVSIVACPGDATGVGKLLGETDAEGRFVKRGSLVGSSCIIQVEKSGYIPRRYDVRDVCVAFTPDESACYRFGLYAELAPRDDGTAGE